MFHLILCKCRVKTEIFQAKQYKKKLLKVWKRNLDMIKTICTLEKSSISDQHFVFVAETVITF